MVMSQTTKPKNPSKRTPTKAVSGPVRYPMELKHTTTGRAIEGEISLHFSTSGRFVVDEITLRSPDENGLEPSDFQLLGKGLHSYLVGIADFIANNVRPTGYPSKPVEVVDNDNPADLWLRHLERVVPGRDGESKAQWIARVWREYYEPTGRSMKELGEDLGLAYVTVRGYCSQEDPTRSKSAKKVNKRG